MNLNDVIKGGRTEKNIVLRPNDVVYISPTILGWIGYKLSDLLFPVQPVRQLGGTVSSAQFNALGFATGGSGAGQNFGGGGGGGRGF
ncbi:MAG: hypothetical protein GY941_06565 [Planctomycetes bacterium]|nr:hypothetical protein [Planctomycetota bacterium]